LLGSFIGAVILVLVGGSSLEHRTDGTYFPFIVFVVPFMFVPFLVVGWPLFLLLRGTRWFRFSLAACVGAAAGVAATALFGGPGLDLLTLGFAATGVISTVVCWWFMSVRPNPPLNTDAPPSGGAPVS
jgi:hypothetical protein